MSIVTDSFSGKIGWHCFKQIFSFATCAAASYATHHASFALFNKYRENCTSVIQTPLCVTYNVLGVASVVVELATFWKMFQIARSFSLLPSKPIPNPTIIPSGSNQYQSSNASFFSVTAKRKLCPHYAAEYPQSIRRSFGVGNYSEVQWNGGSRSI